MVGREFLDFAAADQWDLERELVAAVKDSPSLTLADWCRDIVAAGRAVVKVKATFKWMHRATGIVLGVTG